MYVEGVVKICVYLNTYTPYVHIHVEGVGEMYVHLNIYILYISVHVEGVVEMCGCFLTHTPYRV